MSEQSLGLIETAGLAAAVTAADAAVKSANVTLVGYELTKGDGMAVVKLRGDVGAVKAAIEAAQAAAGRVGRVVATRVIARPADGLKGIVESRETIGWARSGEGYPAATAPHPEAPAEKAPNLPDASSSDASGTQATEEAAPEPEPEPAAPEAPVDGAPEPAAVVLEDPEPQPEAEPASASAPAPKSAPQPSPPRPSRPVKGPKNR
ncbi:BMC domain-containing protein [Rhodobacter maris]|uniref:BMC domain-containing protein n=1 Tax=Rhodobacter maris TaxID=446682 RepID=A0A285SMU5_9RHOB|nr:BMC domain-containing protein [Rhodobacter maris]SOC09378.1 BMC domain-containing protein [Rhodobacter maris]